MSYLTDAARQHAEAAAAMRDEATAVRDSEDMGGLTRVGGQWYDDVPDWSER